MSVEAALEAIDRMEADEAFAERVRDAGGPDASLALLHAEGFDVTPDELRDAVLDRYGDQLDQAQLDALAGGAVPLNDQAWVAMASGAGVGIVIGAVAAILV